MRRSPSAALLVTAATAATLALAGCESPVDPVGADLAPPTEAPRAVAAAAASTHPGSWTPAFTWPTVGVHLIVLPNGKVLTWSSSQYDYAFKIENVFLWDPASWSPMAPGPFVEQPNARTDLFCSSHSFEADGQLLVTGGHAAPDSGDLATNRYDYTNGSAGSAAWSALAPMTTGARWYPTAVTLPDGQTVTMGGTKGTNNWNNVPEVWNGSSWRQLPGATLQLPWYPWAFVAPNGLVFVAGSDSMSRYLDVSGTGRWTNVGVTQFGRPRDRGSAVMYEPGKVLAFGGGGSTLSGPAYVGATNTAEVIDLTAAIPAWRTTGSMSANRRHVNSALLADGTVLAMGGTTGYNFDEADVKTVERWDPATGVWTRLDSTNVVPRAYHGSAVLLPDARVLVAGSGRCPGCAMVDQLNAQLFTPPYLYNDDGTPATRPTIGSAPASVGYGQQFSVATPDAPAAAQVTLVRLPAMTHSFDMNTRFLRLAVSGNSSGSTQLSVTAPSSPNLAPPGHYMLFVINASGVPSVAKIVRIGGAAPPPPPPPTAPAAPTALAAAAAGTGQIDLTWADNAGDETGYLVERCTGTACNTFAQVASLGVDATSYTNTGLAASTSYAYRVRAENAVGASAYSNTATATTAAPPPPPPTAPAAPTALGATAAGTSQINLAWTDNAGDETGYLIERCTGSGCSAFAQVASVGAGTTTYANTGLAAGTSYAYRVRAQNGAGYSGYSNTAAAATAASPPPSGNAVASFTLINAVTDQPIAAHDPLVNGAVINFAAIGTSSLSVRANTSPAVVGSVVFGYDASASYRVENNAPYAIAGDEVVGGVANYVAWTPTVGSHTLKATPYAGGSGTGTVGAAFTISFTVTNGTTAPPAAPSGLSATAAGTSQINLAWADNAANETAYLVERCTGAGCTAFAQVASLGAGTTSYANTGLAAGTTYGFRVRAQNGGGFSGYSNTASATTTTATTPPPAAPTALAATASGSAQINLTWADNATTETGVRVERCTGSACTAFAEIAALGANATSFANSGLAASTSYRYRVRAENAGGFSTYSNIATATTAGASGGQAVVSFTLINTLTDQPVAGHDPLVNGASISFAAIGTSKLSIRANTSPAVVGSVVFGYDASANYRLENNAPYAIAGDAIVNGAPDYVPWTPTVGSHTVSATPYSGGNASGTAGAKITVSFTVSP